MNAEKQELNNRLLAVCTADVIDFVLAEELLKQGAEPLGSVEGEYGNRQSFVGRNSCYERQKREKCYY